MITLDERTGSAELLRYFPADTVKLGRLSYGDASFLGKGQGDVPLLVGIERKTIGDLLNSMESGRLQGHQIPGLVASYNVVYLIVEGVCRNVEGEDDVMEQMSCGKWRAMRVTRKAFDSFLNTLEVLAHIIVRQTSNPKNTASLISNLYCWWQKGWDDHKGHLGFAMSLPPTAQLSKPSLLRRVVKELPGIGWERSKAVADYFGSIEAVVAATEKDWMNIDGIGKVLSKQLVKVIKGETNA